MDENGQDGVIRVFLLDDHEIVRRGVADLLTNDPGITVVGEAKNAAEAVARIPALRPDVALLDVRLPDGDGVSVRRDVRSLVPELKVVMLTSYSDDEALFEAIMAGASGYLLEQVLGQDLVRAVRTVAAGGSLLDPTATTHPVAVGGRHAHPLGAAGRWTVRLRCRRSDDPTRLPVRSGTGCRDGRPVTGRPWSPTSPAPRYRAEVQAAGSSHRGDEGPQRRRTSVRVGDRTHGAGWQRARRATGREDEGPR